MDENQGLLTLSIAAPYVTRVAAELTYDYKDRYRQQFCTLVRLFAGKGTVPLVAVQDCSNSPSCASLQVRLYGLYRLPYAFLHGTLGISDACANCKDHPITCVDL